MINVSNSELEFLFFSAYQVTVQHLNKISKRSADHQRAMQPVYPGNYADSQSHWIAAEFPHHGLPNTFTVGDNNTYGRYYNAPLAPGNSYGISFCSVSSTTKVPANFFMISISDLYDWTSKYYNEQ